MLLKFFGLSVLFVACLASELFAFQRAGVPPSPPGAPPVGNIPITILRHYPMASAREVPATTQIGITASSAFDPSVTSPRYWSVTGSISGEHIGQIHLSDDTCTAIFVPNVPFANSECVNVELSIMGGQHGGIVECEFSFTTALQTIAPVISTAPPFADNMIFSKGRERDSRMQVLDKSGSTSVDNDPMPGKIFLSKFGPGDSPSLMITDEHSNVLLSLPISGSDFVRQPNGQMTYFNGQGQYIAVDSIGTPLHTYSCTNGVFTDGHEFRIQKNGHHYLLGLSQSTEDLTEVGGVGDAQIQGGVIQAFDSSGNLIFEWRGIDHYRVEDDVEPGDLTQSSIDFQHANSIDVDSNGNYLISNRNLSEITKIDGGTGNIIWRFGGKQNQFTLAGDTLGISAQHFARWQKNGDILLFDNGVYHSTPESRAVEYYLDTTTMTATMKWEYRHDPPLFSDVMGNAERLRNGNTFIGWGSNVTVSATEVDSNGNVVYEMTLPGGDNSYRAIKYSAPTAPSDVRNSSPLQPLSFTLEPIPSGFDASITAPSPMNGSLVIYDVAGRSVENIFEGQLIGGARHIVFSTSTLANGSYFCVLHTSNGAITKPFVVAH